MPREITLKVSKDLVHMVQGLAEKISKNIGGDPPEFFVEYYLFILPHLAALYPIGEVLGFNSKHSILDLGSGLGTRCLLGKATWDAKFTGLEPCFNTYSFLKKAILEFQRVNPHLPYAFVNKFGEDTGLQSESYDFVLCGQVLEHVQDPAKVISEVYRVLKPNGKFFFSTCNYRSFYEGHYRCLWFPFFGKRTGQLWVNFLGYNPKLLDEINFITRRDILSYLNQSGFKNIMIEFNIPRYPLPLLRVELPESFSPIYQNKRKSYLGILIQHPLIQKVFSFLGMEYKIYGVAEKL